MKHPKLQMNPITKGICHRCEYRVQYIEQGHAPRFECGEISLSKYGCYMYRPVSPVVLAQDKHEKRSVMLPVFLRGRSHGIGIAVCKSIMTGNEKKGFVIYAYPMLKQNKAMRRK